VAVVEVVVAEAVIGVQKVKKNHPSQVIRKRPQINLQKKKSKVRLNTTTALSVGSQGSDHPSPQSSPPSSGAGTPTSELSLTPPGAEVGKGGELLTGWENSDDFSPDLTKVIAKKVTGSRPKSKKKDSALLD